MAPHTHWLLVALLAGCAPSTPTPGAKATADATADHEPLLARCHGTLLRREPLGGIVALTLPVRRLRMVRTRGSTTATGTVHALTAPARDGRLCYVEDFVVAPPANGHHRLRWIHSNGSDDRIVFERPGNAMWATSAAGRGEIGGELALAPSGERVALLVQTTDVQLPGALLTEGRLEIHELHRGGVHAATARALDAPMAWTPDGGSLVFAALAPRHDVPPAALARAAVPAAWPFVPVVRRLDLATGSEHFVAIGDRVDATTTLAGQPHAWVHTWDAAGARRWACVGVPEGVEHALQVPAWTEQVLAVVDDDLLVLAGCPQGRANAPRGRRASPLVAPPPLQTILLFEPSNGHQLLLTDQHDPRLDAVYGPVP